MDQERTQLRDVVEVQQLTRQGADTIVITPDTQVLCIHRGRRQTADGAPVYHPNAAGNRRTGWKEQYFAGDYKDTYDGNHYVVGPGYFTAPFGAARHFQERAVVPGSRNPETQGQRSFISIIGVVQAHPGGGFEVLKSVDDPQEWEPFTDEQCHDYEIAFEAIDRAAMLDPIDRDVRLETVRPGAAAPRTKLPVISTTDASVLEKQEGPTAAQRDAAQRGDAGAAGGETGDDAVGTAGDGDAGDDAVGTGRAQQRRPKK
jgi:hypothetical protein